jgi:hypothetical protein
MKILSKEKMEENYFKKLIINFLMGLFIKFIRKRTNNSYFLYVKYF